MKEILWNKKKSEEITKKLNDEHQHHRDNKKQGEKNLQGNIIDADLENPDFILYATSNEKGECTIGQCTNSLVNLLGYLKSEIVGKKIEVLMPKIFIEGHARMLSESIKKIHLKQNSERNSYRENDKKKVFKLLVILVAKIPQNSPYNLVLFSIRYFNLLYFCVRASISCSKLFDSFESEI